MILGIMSIAIPFLFVGIILGILAIKKCSINTDKDQEGVAIAGKVTGIIGLVIGCAQMSYLILIIALKYK